MVKSYSGGGLLLHPQEGGCAVQDCSLTRANEIQLPPKSTTGMRHLPWSGLALPGITRASGDGKILPYRQDGLDSLGTETKEPIGILCITPTPLQLIQARGFSH